MTKERDLLLSDFLLRMTSLSCFTLFIAAIYKITGKASDIGLLSLFTVGPSLLIVSTSGKYTATMSPLGMLKSGLLLRIGLFLCALLVVNTPTCLFIGAGLQSLLQQVSMTAKRSLDAVVVAPENRRQYNSKKAILANIAMVTGPALGGVLVSSLGINYAFLALMAIDVVNVIVVQRLRLSTNALKLESDKIQGPSLLNSLAHLWSIQRTAAIIAVFCVVSIVLEMECPLLFPFVHEVYKANSGFTGTLLGLTGFGGIVGGIAAHRFPKLFKEESISWLFVLDGVFFFIFTQLRQPVLASILFMTLGFLGAITLVLVETVIQRDIEEKHRPFVFSLMQFAGGAGGASVGIGAAYLADSYGAKSVLAACAGFEVLFGLFLICVALAVTLQTKGTNSGEKA